MKRKRKVQLFTSIDRCWKSIIHLSAQSKALRHQLDDYGTIWCDKRTFKRSSFELYLARNEAQRHWVTLVLWHHRQMAEMVAPQLVSLTLFCERISVKRTFRLTGMDSASQVNNSHLPEPVRIIHKEQESISAFCLNLQNPGLLALATPRECQEMDITLLLESPNWLEDECELDIMNLTKDIDTQPASNFLMIQSSADK